MTLALLRVGLVLLAAWGADCVASPSPRNGGEGRGEGAQRAPDAVAEGRAPAAGAARAGQAGSPARQPRWVTLGTHEHEVGGVDVILTEIVRSGDSLTVRWQYVNQAQEAKVLAGGTGQTLVPYLLTAEAFLFDEVHGKKYLVVHDASGQPVTSRYGGPYDVVLGAGQTIEAWAKFPAPLPAVESITILIPGVPAFENVRMDSN